MDSSERLDRIERLSNDRKVVSAGEFLRERVREQLQQALRQMQP